VDQRPRAIAASSFYHHLSGVGLALKTPDSREMRRLEVYAYKIDYVNYYRSINVEKLNSLNSPTSKALSLLSLYRRR
jgi:hypothetical protein